MEKEDIINWLERNKKFIKLSSLEKRVGVPNGYISFYVLNNKKYPETSFGRDYIPYSEFIQRLGDVIRTIRAF